MIRVAVGKECLVIDKLEQGNKEYIILRNKKEIMELFKGLGELCWFYSKDLEEDAEETERG